MSRIARVVIPQCPHHITQRGVRSMQLFLNDDDKRRYLGLIKAEGDKYGVEFIAYCLMSNHTHLVAVPEREDSLARAIGEAHRKYTLEINERYGVRGYLFQGRFYSCPMDERHFISAALYAERNPVRAGICRKAWEYPWSSAGFHAGSVQNDPVVVPGGLKMAHGEWRKMLESDPLNVESLRRHCRTGVPIGSRDFIRRAESITGRQFMRAARDLVPAC